MADSKITDLGALTGANLATGDQFVVVDVSDTSMDASGTDKKMSADELSLAPVLRRARVLDEVHADAGSASSSAEQTLATLVLTGGVVAAGDYVRFVASGDQINNSGAGVTYTWKFKIGSTTVLTSAANSLASSAQRRKWVAAFDVYFPTTASERVGGVFDMTSINSANFDVLNTATCLRGYGTAAEDSASNLNVILTCQLGTSVSTADVILHAASLQLVKK